MLNSKISQEIYINCFLFDNEDDGVVSCYKIEGTLDVQNPFLLFRRSMQIPSVWKNLSTCSSIYEAVSALLKELLLNELSDDVHLGEATVDPQPILNLLNKGESTITIFGSVDNELIGIGHDIVIEELILRSRVRRKRINTHHT